MPIVLPELAIKRYTEFVENFNKFKLVNHPIDLKTYNYQEKLLEFFTKIDSDEKLFKYLLTKNKILFHKNNKLSFLHKINLYNLIDANIDASLTSFIWETVQMIHLIIADGQNELSKNQVHIDALLDNLDGMGKKKGSIDLKKITNAISKIDSSILSEFLSVSGLDKIDLASIDMKQLQDFKSLTPDKIKSLS